MVNRKEVEELWIEGLSDVEIAQELNCSKLIIWGIRNVELQLESNSIDNISYISMVAKCLEKYEEYIFHIENCNKKSCRVCRWAEKNLRKYLINITAEHERWSENITKELQGKGIID